MVKVDGDLVKERAYKPICRIRSDMSMDIEQSRRCCHIQRTQLPLVFILPDTKHAFYKCMNK